MHWHGFKTHPVPVQKRRAHACRSSIGGSKGKAFERVAKYGDGWYAPTAAVSQLEPLVKQLHAACAKIGRDPKTVEISCMWIPSAERWTR